MPEPTPKTPRQQPPELVALLREVRACDACKACLPAGPRPVLQAGAHARILVAGQAPGRKVHESGIPFDDASGERLRRWMGMAADTFYDEDVVALLPMGFCYPGKAPSGDLPPRKECAPLWRGRLLAAMPRVELTLVVGNHAMAWHFHGRARQTLTQTVRAWREAPPSVFPLPHPSPLNNAWLKANPWFEAEAVPALQERIRAALGRRVTVS